MTSLSLAWVVVTMVNKGWEIDVYPFFFVLTGLVDIFIAYAVFAQQ